jgi:hypothetical protein
MIGSIITSMMPELIIYLAIYMLWWSWNLEKE